MTGGWLSFSGNAPPTPGGAGAAPRSIGALGAFPLLELRPPWRLEEAPGPPPRLGPGGFSCRSVQQESLFLLNHTRPDFAALHRSNLALSLRPPLLRRETLWFVVLPALLKTTR